MRSVVWVVRWLVGILFIFSGLVKANDPLGLSYKMQEFFEVWGWSSFEHYTLFLAEAMNVFEIVLGVAVIVGWRMRLMTQSMLLLIVFFTFLTGYALFSGKIKTCGCFGDCLPLSPVQSFIKDLVLLVLSVFLLWKTKLASPLVSQKLSIGMLVASLIATVFLQSYVLKHLPLVDCLPYKIGNNLPELMKKPADAIPDSTVIIYKYQKNGAIKEFDSEHFPENFDSTYVFVNRYDKLVRKGSGGAKISDFGLTTLSGNDTTAAVLQSNCVLIAIKDLNDHPKQWEQAVNTVVKEAQKKHLPVLMITPHAEVVAAAFAALPVTVLKCDATVLKTMARVNPTFFWMERGTVKAKLSYAGWERFVTMMHDL